MRLSRPALALLCGAAALSPAAAAAEVGAITPVATFGSNPGGLAMFEYVPSDVPDGAPLVMMMHGCTQAASGLTATGLLEVAERHKFYVVLPQQSAVNNPYACFNFAGENGDPANLIRGQGENLSLKQMIDHMKASHSIDADRVFVAGFSAGGSMAAVMMATWPEVFAGGAIMSGVPYRCATTALGAYQCMQMSSFTATRKTPAAWGDLVRAAAPDHDGPWPRTILFHGASDATVTPDNHDELIEQWSNVHGLPLAPSTSETIAGHQRRTWRAGGETVLESWRIAGMAHTVAIGEDPEEACGTVGANVDDRDVCAVYRMVRFFGIAGGDVPGGDADAGPGDADAGPGEADAGAGDGPTVSIASPADGDEVGGAVSIAVDAAPGTSGELVARVEFLIDDLIRAADALPPYTHVWQTANAAPGSHTVKAIAYDLLDRPSEASVTVTVVAGDDGGIPIVDPLPLGCAAGGGLGSAAGLLALAGLRGHSRRRKLLQLKENGE